MKEKQYAERDAELAWRDSKILELRARVERLEYVIRYSEEYLGTDTLNSIGHGSKAHMEMKSVLEETPPQSLTRFKVGVVQEAVEAVSYMVEWIPNDIDYAFDKHIQHLINEAKEKEEL